MNIFLLATITFGLFISLEHSEVDGSNNRFLDLLFRQCNCRCGRSNRSKRILGGEVLRGYELPWLASIQIKGGKSVQGTLINSRYVVTSASLLMGLTPYDIKVTLGLFDRCYSDVSSTNYSVDAIKLHPEYGPTNRAHDIALIRLISEVNFETRVSPVCLAFPARSYVGQVGTVVGWSDLDGNNKDLHCRPRKMGLPILGPRECFSTMLDTQFFSNDKGCVGVIGATSGVCKIDAGGPVMYKDYDGVLELIGILSDKNECGKQPSTALYTAINSHIEWLKENTKVGCYCYK